jgi:nucleotide-binding universal stress UspA family protein
VGTTHAIEEAMIKDIVVNLSVGAKHDVAATVAISVAAAFEAHLSAIALAYEPLVPGSPFGGAVAGIVQTARTEAVQAASLAVGSFDEALTRNRLAGRARLLESGLAGAPDLFAQIARRFDLSIVAQADPDATGPERSILEATLFESGRPILIVPYIHTAPLRLDRVMACWDGSRNAARAIGDALPFLTRAKAVTVFTASDEDKGGEIEGADIGHHLARHGLKVEVERQALGDVDIASAILSRAADIGADLIVMGGYGHSRVREFVLGGATRGILAAMTVPVLMSH